MQVDHTAYFLLEIPLGREIFRVLRVERQFPEARSRFSTASVVLAFCQIHSHKITCRDIKPGNLMLDAGGYLEIVDLGLATHHPLAQVVFSEGHDWVVDYWAPGVPVYEMTAGTLPFWAEDPRTSAAARASSSRSCSRPTSPSTQSVPRRRGPQAEVVLGLWLELLWMQVFESGTIEIWPSEPRHLLFSHKLAMAKAAGDLASFWTWSRARRLDRQIKPDD